MIILRCMFSHEAMCEFQDNAHRRNRSEENVNFLFNSYAKLCTDSQSATSFGWLSLCIQKATLSCLIFGF